MFQQTSDPMDNESPLLSQSTRERVHISIEGGRLVDVSEDTVFELIRDICDPEHPYSLERLGVVCIEDIEVHELTTDEVLCSAGVKCIDVAFTPTVPHCSMAGIIGLSIRAQLERFVSGYWIRVTIKKEMHNTYAAINKQLLDKDRTMAAFENEGLREVIEACICESQIKS